MKAGLRRCYQGSAFATLDENSRDYRCRRDGKDAAPGKRQWRPQPDAERDTERYEGICRAVEDGQSGGGKDGNLSDTSHLMAPAQCVAGPEIRLPSLSVQNPRHTK